MANSTVVKALALLELDPAVQGRVDAGELSPAAAYEVSKLETPEDQREVAGRIVSERLTRDEAAVAVREKSGRPQKERTASRGEGARAGRAQYRLPDGTTVAVGGPAALAGPVAVVAALEAALELARQEVGRGQAA